MCRHNSEAIEHRSVSIAQSEVYPLSAADKSYKRRIGFFIPPVNGGWKRKPQAHDGAGTGAGFNRATAADLRQSRRPILQSVPACFRRGIESLSVVTDADFQTIIIDIHLKFNL